MKVNLTKKHVNDLEKAVKLIESLSKALKLTGAPRKEVVDVRVSLSDILVRHENRTEKDY